MVKIVTDSSCDISPQRCAELGVEMLPITVNFGGESYRANLDISNEEFYEKLAAAEELPHTAQITPAQFQEIFKPYQESGDDVVCLFIGWRPTFWGRTTSCCPIPSTSPSPWGCWWRRP